MSCTRALLLLVGAATLLVPLGCSPVDPSPLAGSSVTFDPDLAPDADAGAPRHEPPPPTAACQDGVVRECKVTFVVDGRVRSCFVGVEMCADGAWGRCVDPETLELDDSDAGAR